MAVTCCAELGINHQGSLETAKELITKAAWAGADYAKFQARTPTLCVPKDQWQIPKLTPWGETMPYIDYREAMEFDLAQMIELTRHADREGIKLFLSVWDIPSLELATKLSFDYVKIPSAKLTDLELVSAAAVFAVRSGTGLMMSTGMSTQEEVLAAVAPVHDLFADQDPDNTATLTIMHCNSAYPAVTSELNLYMLLTMREWWGDEIIIGYSGHELGIAASVWAAVLGAEVIERHITLDQRAVGSDHAASLEPLAFARLVNQLRSVESALGDGVKRVYDSELPARAKLRGDQ